jgi:hypothetical protein
MTKIKVIYEEESVLFAKYYHPKSDDYLEYITKILIKDSGKTPVQMNLKFDGILPAYDTIQSKRIIEFHLVHAN